MRKFLLILIMPIFILSEDYSYSLEDFNSTSPTYAMNVWIPEYLDFITMHYFSSQG